MAVRVCVRNTFVCLDSHCGFKGGKDRAHTEGSLHLEDDCEFTRQHVQKLQSILSHDIQARRPQVIQDSSESCQSFGSSLGKVGSFLSSSSVSTIAFVDESNGENPECGESVISWADSDDENLWQHRPVRAASPRASQSRLVPKRVNLVEGYAKSRREGQAMTTVMIRSIPNRCSQHELIAELEAAGFQGCFDFLYIPLDVRTMSNVGFAFVNFTQPAQALRCMRELPKHHFKRQKAGKAVAVLPAHMQGLEANLRHYEKTAVNTSRLRQRRPVVMNVFNAVSSASSA